MREKDWQRRVTDLCTFLGVKWFHSGDSRRDSCRGYPDLTLVGKHETIFVELKSQTGIMSADQREWREALEKTGRKFYLWRPSDWMEVQHVLRDI